MSPKLELVPLPETIRVARTDPIYNCHGYLTKVPIGAIQLFIETFTEPGALSANIVETPGTLGMSEGGGGEQR